MLNFNVFHTLDFGYVIWINFHPFFNVSGTMGSPFVDYGQLGDWGLIYHANNQYN